MSEACFILFAKFYLSELLFLVAVVTAYYAQCGIHGVEDCSHRLIVGDALGVVAFHDPFNVSGVFTVFFSTIS